MALRKAIQLNCLSLALSLFPVCRFAKLTQKHLPRTDSQFGQLLFTVAISHLVSLGYISVVLQLLSWHACQLAMDSRPR